MMERRIEALSPASVPVLIVDDSVVARAVLKRIIEGDARYRVAGMVGDAEAALAFLAQTSVGVILLDIEMPGRSGLAALPAILEAGRGAHVLIVSSTCEAGAQASVRALALGAADTLEKPGAGVLAGRFAQTLHERLARIAGAAALPGSASNDRPSASPDRAPPAVIAIGASTGGIHALGQMLAEIDESCTAPILVTQHLPPTFMPYFAAQVALLARRPCHVAEDRMRLRAGHAYIAPGDGHLLCAPMTGGYVIRLDRSPAESGCMPSVDPMFASLAQTFGSGALGVMLSGMGRDGLQGARKLVEAGGSLLAQDRATSVVWGMPGAVANAGLTEAVMPPDALGRAVQSRFRAKS